MNKVAAAVRAFPAEASFLAVCASRGYGDRQIKAGIAKLAAVSATANDRWAAFLTKLADGAPPPVAPGVPKINAMPTPPPAIPRPDPIDPHGCIQGNKPLTSAHAAPAASKLPFAVPKINGYTEAQNQSASPSS
jgi:hypothetical protein